MFAKLTLAFLLTATAPAFASDGLPPAINCYQTATNDRDINAYLDCFTHDAVMIDVTRTFEGRDAIQRWALREVIPGGESFKHIRILEEDEGYAKAEVNWSSWVAHYFYWWDAEGKITKMSLQYAN